MQAEVVAAQATSATEIITMFSVHETGEVWKTHGSVRRIRKGGWSTQRGMKNETQHVLAILGRPHYAHQRRRKTVCLPLSHARYLAVHGLSVLRHGNCLCSTLNACMRVFGRCLNLLLKSPISPVKIILFVSEQDFSSTCPQCNIGLTWTTRAWSVLCISAGTALSLQVGFPGFDKYGHTSKRPVYTGHSLGRRPLLHQLSTPVQTASSTEHISLYLVQM